MECDPPLLVTAIERRNLEMVKLLLDQDEVDPGFRLPFPLQSAYACGDQQFLDLLLQSDWVNVNAKTYGGLTALIKVVCSGAILRGQSLTEAPEN